MSGDAAGGAVKLRVYYEDTDAGGVVYHANYARYFERARTEFLRRAGFESGKLREEWNVLFVVRTLKMEYLRPAVLDDLLLAEARPFAYGRVYVDFRHSARRADGGEVLATAEARVVCVCASTLRAAALPPPLADTIEAHVG